MKKHRGSTLKFSAPECIQKLCSSVVPRLRRSVSGCRRSVFCIWITLSAKPQNRTSNSENGKPPSLTETTSSPYDGTILSSFRKQFVDSKVSLQFNWMDFYLSHNATLGHISRHVHGQTHAKLISKLIEQFYGSRVICRSDIVTRSTLITPFILVVRIAIATSKPF